MKRTQRIQHLWCDKLILLRFLLREILYLASVHRFFFFFLIKFWFVWFWLVCYKSQIYFACGFGMVFRDYIDTVKCFRATYISSLSREHTVAEVEWRVWMFWVLFQPLTSRIMIHWHSSSSLGHHISVALIHGALVQYACPLPQPSPLISQISACWR